MNNRTLQKTLLWMLTLCLLLGSMAGAMAQDAPAQASSQSKPTSDFEALEPLMDMVTCAVISNNSEQPEVIPGSEGMLSNEFVTTFVALWQKATPGLGLSQEVAADPQQQKAVLGKLFSAALPELAAVTQAKELNGYIGFHPVTVNTAADSGGIQIVGEIYWANKPIRELSDEEYQQVLWMERAIFTFQSDPGGWQGYRLAGFSSGTELNMELAVQNYFDQILVEYVNTGLGFSVQYPSKFTDDMLEEDDAGVSAKLPDGSASFFAKRADNVNQANLKDYVDIIANGITGSQAQVNEEFRYATVGYTTDEGYRVFDVYVVTDKYIFQAELSYRTELSKEYSMYTTYLENTFMVDEVSVG